MYIFHKTGPVDDILYRN